MANKSIPAHPAALYFNELVPERDEECTLFGHFYHPPADDVDLTRAVVARPAGGWAVIDRRDVNDVVSGGVYYERSGRKQLIAVYRRGESFFYPDARGAGRIAIPIPPNVGFLSGVRMIDAWPYACGSQNAVYRFDGAAWVDVAGPMRVAYGGPNDPILNAIDGFDECDIYAVGYNGSVVHFDGTRWHPLDAPTNQHLHQVLCHADGQVYVCGRGGTVIKGRLDVWEDLSSPERTEDFWGMAAFNGEVYLCTYHQLFRIVDRDLTEVHVPVNSAGTFYRVASNASFLWGTTGTGRVLRFDGQDWIELVWPDSV
ncbi:hypothetical protein LJ656_06845 [Paraburkholderia sp. MMS20-SJTR3]|uniref:Uncharacterized protein n=1 Tax=Paraburkholderia sejongensis TaxID=2886946 RepID=A0ABS8JQX0_9BURK|nr:hypothetical protein [Paraburkholderia sp. MMS20-SJTR3]MCC8392303.1 hypothetical protein [Paraburkholderia sp. MMS20-SJTR3]